MKALLPSLAALLVLGGCLGRQSHVSAARYFDQGEVDQGCVDARAAFALPQHVKNTATLRSLLDRCAFELATREGTAPALSGYIQGAPERSLYAPAAKQALCKIDARNPGCTGEGFPTTPLPRPIAGTPAPTSPLPDVSKRLPTGAKSPGDVALVIGLEKYPFASDVPHAKSDAEAFATWLRYSRGVPDERVVVLSSGNVENVREAAAKVAGMTSPDGVVWLYYAGHGAAHPATRARLLLGDDLRPDAGSLTSRGMPVEELERSVRGKAKKLVAVLDTCFAGTGRDGAPLIEGGRFAIPTYALRLDDTVEWAATGPGEIAVPLPGASHGAFTYFALGALRGWADGELDAKRDGTVTLEEATVYVKRMLKERGLVDMNPSLTTTQTASAEKLAEPAPETDPDWASLR